jgi:pimeloyl-ACP methyl ester carboxylesterase
MYDARQPGRGRGWLAWQTPLLMTFVAAATIGANGSRAVDSDKQLPARQTAPAQPNAATPVRQGIAGSWQGTLDLGIKLRIVFNIAKSDDGKLSGTLDSPDQAANGIRISEITFAGDALRLAVKSIGGSFEGKLDAAAGEIAGHWAQEGQLLPLTLKPIDKPPELNRPQVPKKPYPYDEEEVSYENQTAGIKLAGTITLPRTKGPFPAVLLISGSGAQDRDESLLGHKPFLVLADDLTRRGIAVLRVDDRGVGGSTGNSVTATTADFVGDVMAGVEFLKSRQEIDPRRIGLVGHSEGGLIAPAAAVRTDDIAFIVLIAGPGVTGEEILYAQGALIMRAGGASDEAIAKQRTQQEQMFAIVKDFDKQVAGQSGTVLGDAAEAAKEKLKQLVVAAPAELPEDQRKTARIQGEAQPRLLLSNWFRYFLTYDPRPALAKVRCPVLAVIGERDLQVPPKDNLLEIERALKAGGNADYTLRELPGLNHLLQTCKTGSPAEYGQIEETISPDALALIGEWIVERASR